jgi:putative ABC transport system permease protein
LWRDHNRTLEAISMIRPDSHILSGRGEAPQVNGVRVSLNLFHLLGIQPAIGRSFIKGEDTAGRQHVVLISHRLTAGDRPTPPLTQWKMPNYCSASKTYFQAAGIQLTAGRPFDERDGDSTEVMISENLAERLWPGQSAVGRPLRIYNKRLMNVVGIVGATYAASLTQQPAMMVYFPDWRRQDLNMSLVVRTENKPESISGAVRRIIHDLEPQAAIPSIQTMRQVVARSVSEQRFQVILLATFAGIAVVLACLGIYGVLAFTISRRTSEIGVRMALGARPNTILRSTLRTGMAPVLTGIVVGLSISAALSRVVASLLFGVHALDLWTYVGTSLILLLIAALACLIPARRAARLNPIEALRNE